jgi:WD40 repeat protein
MLRSRYSLRSGELELSMHGHLGCVWRGALAPRRRVLVTAGEDASLKVWPLAAAGTGSGGSEELPQEGRDESGSSAHWECSLQQQQQQRPPGAATAPNKQHGVKCFALSWPDGGTLFAATSAGEVHAASLDEPQSPLRCIWSAASPSSSSSSAELSFTSVAVVGESTLLLGDVSGRAVMIKLAAAPGDHDGAAPGGSAGAQEEGEGQASSAARVARAAVPAASPDGPVIVWQAHSHRVLSVRWQPELGERAVLTASPNGEARLWRRQRSSSGGWGPPILHATFHCATRNAIKAVLMVRIKSAPGVALLCGDNKGMLHVFGYPNVGTSPHDSDGVDTGDSGSGGDLSSSDSDDSAVWFSEGEMQLRLPPADDTITTTTQIKRGGRIVSIVWHQDLAYVLARDAYIVRYAIVAQPTDSLEPGTSPELNIQLVGKTKAGNSIAGIDEVLFGDAVGGQATAAQRASAAPTTEEGEMLVVGFRGADFVLWNVTKHYQICRIPCGGGRRPYILRHRPAAPSEYTLAFAAGHGSTVAFHTPQHQPTSLSPLLSLNANFHGRDVNAVLFVRLCRHWSAVTETTAAPVAVVTGSEDTLLKVRGHRVVRGVTEEHRGSIGQHTLHGHPSAIKALCCSHIDGRWPLLFSVGAKESILAWQLSTEVGNHQSEEDRTEGGAAPRFSSQLLYRWSPKMIRRLRGHGGRDQSGVAEDTLDHRFHAVTAFPVPGPSSRHGSAGGSGSAALSSSSTHAVAVGGTSSTVDVWLLDEASRSVQAAALLSGQSGLVLCLAHTLVRAAGGGGGPGLSLLAAGDTGGSVCLWDVSTAVAASASTTMQPPQRLGPVHLLRGVHESGVNCMCMLARGSSSVLVITGGDDQSIHVGCVELAQGGSGPASLKLSTLHVCRYPYAHSSSLKGLSLGRLGSDLFFSTAADCRVHVWKLHCDLGCATQPAGDDDGAGSDEAAIRVERLSSAVLSVTNVAACSAISANGHNIHDVAVVGRGLDLQRFTAALES